MASVLRRGLYMTLTAKRPLYQLLSESRRKQGITQSALAKQSDCKQSAISMMERGREDALSWPKIQTVAKVLGIDVEVYAPEIPVSELSTERATGYCPIFDCPANIPYAVNGRLYALPRITVDHGEKHCAYCGELLENSCPECGAHIRASAACCRECGSAYITTPERLPEGADNWAAKQRANLKDIGLI
jgi:transcriptional regulator with XRE-family HTH domain